MKKYIVRPVCCIERVKELMNSIPDLWFEINEIFPEQSWILSFGSNKGIIIYTYEFTIYQELERLLNELGF